MRIAVIGVGHVGLVSAACLARWGHDVVGMDDDDAKVETLRDGDVPFHEPDLPELIDEGTAAGRLTFTGDLAEALDGAEVAFVCVGTPSLPGGAPNLAYVERVGREAAGTATGDLVLVEKSTVPAHTGQRLEQVIAREQARSGSTAAIAVASNPEFLREGSAVHDTLNPDRIVVGTVSARAAAALRSVYAPLLDERDVPYIETDLNTAEMIKHASNAFLATRISFINAVARICEEVGADVDTVAEGMGHDHRIGPHFLRAGLGYGGSCLVADETVLARRGDDARHVTIGELWAEVAAIGLDGWEVLAWDPERRHAAFSPVAAATARPYRGDLIEVRTEMGRRLRCTPDHPFVVGDGDSQATTVRLAAELSTDDWLPVAGRRASAGEVTIRTGPLEALRAGVGATVGRDASERLGPSLRDVDDATAASGTSARGAMVHEGEPWRELGRAGHLRRLPDVVWQAPDEHKRALLRGLWDGDGSWSLGDGGRSVVLEYETASWRLADGMVRLLGDLGSVASVRVGRTATSTADTYRLSLSGADAVEAALWLAPDEDADEVGASISGQTERVASTGYRRWDDSTAWVRVTGTQREVFDGLVYSLEVPGPHTVVTSGGLVTHNCFPKDVDAFIHLARSVGRDLSILEEVRAVNEDMRRLVLDKLRAELWHLEGKTVTLLGAAFKPGTDDLRHAPAIWLAEQLLADGADVRVYDPVALPNVKRELPDVELVDDPLAACRDAHAAVVCTEWDEVTALAPEDLAAALAYPIVVDGRNALDRDAMVAAGIHYHGIGRPSPRVTG